MRDTPRIPITIVSGFQGAGKSALLNHVKSTVQGLTLVTLAHDMHELSMDALFEDLEKVASEGAEAVLIESTGSADPFQIAESFAHHEEEGGFEAPLELDTFVTVVDCESFLNELLQADNLDERELEQDEDDARTVSDLLIEQVEFSNVIVMNKTDRVSAEDKGEARAILERLNRKATVVECVFGKVSPETLLGTSVYDPEEMTAGLPPKGTCEESEEFGISHLIYRARRPFHPGRFWSFISDDSHSIIRSLGFIWFATRSDFVAYWSQAGGSCRIEPQGTWWALIPQDEWNLDEEERQDLMADWDATLGDRRQELYLVGRKMDKEAVLAKLNACLLTDSEFGSGDAAWSLFEDPLPLWHAGEEDEHSDCGHDHGEHEQPGQYSRFEFSAKEKNRFKSLKPEQLNKKIEEFLSEGLFGKAVPLQEILIEKLAPEQSALSLSATSQFRLALLYGEIHEGHRALPLWREIVQTLRSSSSHIELACEAMHHSGLALLACGLRPHAEQTFQEGLKFATEHNLSAWKGVFLHEIGANALNLERLSQARTTLTEALRLRDGNEPYGLAATLYQMGRLDEIEGHVEQAKEHLEKALRLLKAGEGNFKEVDRCQEALARLNAAQLRKKLQSEL